MFRKLLASLAITTCCLANPLPAKSALSTCWFPQNPAQVAGDESIPSQPCDVVIRTENETHFVYIGTPNDGAMLKLGFFYDEQNEPMYVLLYNLEGKKVGSMFFEIDDAGDIRVFNSSSSFFFSVPEATPQPEVLPAQDFFSGRGLTT